MRTLPLRRFAPLLVLLALLVSACGSVEEQPAATVAGRDISAESIEDELKVIRENDAYRQALEQAYSVELAGTGSKGTFDSSFTAQLLSLRIYYTLLEESLAAAGIEVTDEAVRAARDSVEEQVSSLGEGVFEKFPAAYRTRLARQEALVNLASEEATSGVIAEAYFEKHKGELRQACVSHILVAFEGRTPEAAQARVQDLKAQLDGGADFAALARANSDDPGSAAGGGTLDCGAPGRFVEAFDRAVFEQPVGEVGAPVETEFGYHLILVTERGAPELEDVREELSQAALNDYLLELTCGDDAEVEIDPRYGRWDTGPCEEAGSLAQVSAPAAPANDK